MREAVATAGRAHPSRQDTVLPRRGDGPSPGTGPRPAGGGGPRRARTVSAASAVLVLGTVLSPSAAAEETATDTGRLVLTGQRSVQATFTLAQIGHLASPPLDLSGGGSYVAARLQHVGGHHGQTAVVVRSLGPGEAEQTRRSGFDDELPAGTYTLTLLSDAPATVTLNFGKPGQTRSIAPSRLVRSGLRTGRASVPETSGQARLVLKDAVPPEHHAISAMSLGSPTRLGMFRECFTEAETCSGTALAIDLELGPVGGRGISEAAPARGHRNAVFAVDGVRQGADTLHAATLSYGACPDSASLAVQEAARCG